MKITNKQRKRAEQRVKEQVIASLVSAENYGANEIPFEHIANSISVDLNLFKLRRHYQAHAEIWPTT